MSKSRFLFLLMIAIGCNSFGVGASAQKVVGEVSFAVGSGATTPAAGQNFVSAIHTRTNSEPNAPAGTKYLMVKFMKDGKQLTGGQSQLSPQQVKALEGKQSDNLTITKVENPLPIRPYDGLKLTIYDNNLAFVEIEVIQGSAKKSLGKMKIYLKK